MSGVASVTAPDAAATAFTLEGLRAGVGPLMGDRAIASAIKTLRRLRSESVALADAKTRIAVLGAVTTTRLTALIDLFLFGRGVEAEIYEAPFGLLRQQILDPESDLYAFKPDFVFLAAIRRDLGPGPAPGARPEEVEAHIADTAAEWLELHRIVHDRLGCQVIQNTFETPPLRAYGHLEGRFAAAPAQIVQRVNLALAQQAQPYVALHDVDALAANAGRWSWGDDRFFHIAKLPCAPEHLPAYAHSVASIIAARLGRSRKCLVLDLDNTLWGGVIGDDGLAGIALGQGDAVGEAYVAFQHYVKALRSRGVILAVCSKNEDAAAREPFEKHPDMVLRLSDIACFVANWNDKAANLRAIAAELNIGLDALVFADDNPAERKIVRDLAPQVAVPELPVDPADYARTLDLHAYFEPAALSAEDFQRTEMYQANAARRVSETSGGDIETYLRSLEMRAWIGPIGAMELDRSVQLIGKSNQFNLTTRRRSVSEVAAMAGDPGWITRAIKLSDRFGDNGLISVLLAKIEGDRLDIDTWLMSCRVLKRGVEQLALNDLAAAARARGLRAIQGEYIPTAKNALVKDHYAQLGFEKIGEDADGRTRWSLRLDGDWREAAHHIERLTT
ncbi:MAG: HAD-IIIC family phosphatase [Hyphomonadaceae bacterium]|nr:HAD-IIIC family phosphatase [Hyphomonadaceae bacterium]